MFPYNTDASHDKDNEHEIFDFPIWYHDDHADKTIKEKYIGVTTLEVMW